MADHLSLSEIELDDLVTALHDHGDWSEWYLDPATGRIVLSVDEATTGLPDEDTDGMIAIDPLPSSQAYGTMMEFATAVPDPHVRDLLRRALEGKGAFRRFRRALDEWPPLGLRWRDVDGLASELRALGWLVAQDVVGRDELDAAIHDRSRRMDAILAEVGDGGVPRVDADEVPDRWSEIVRRVDEGGVVVVTRDGTDWCTITPARTDDAG